MQIILVRPYGTLYPSMPDPRTGVLNYRREVPDGTLQFILSVSPELRYVTVWTIWTIWAISTSRYLVHPFRVGACVRYFRESL